MLIKYLLLLLAFAIPVQAAEMPETPLIIEEVLNIPAGCEDFVPILKQYDWNVQTALNIIEAESGCNPNAGNPNDVHRNYYTNEVICIGSYGLFQIACLDGILYDIEKNVEVAYYKKYKTERSWKHWSVCTNGTVDCGV